MLNIVNNIPDVDLGENLRSFKEFTMPFTPALRGDAINNFEFVKRIHNSFARYVAFFHPTIFFDLLIDPYLEKWTFSIRIYSSRPRQLVEKRAPRAKMTTNQIPPSTLSHLCLSWANYGNSMAWSDSLVHLVCFNPTKCRDDPC